MNHHEYEFVRGFRNSGLNAQRIGEELAEIADASESQLWPEKTVERARDPDSAMHDHFEWDDAKAAVEHRLEQARYLHRSVIVVVREKDKKGEDVEFRHRAFIHVTKGKARQPYRKIGDVVEDKDLEYRARHQAYLDLCRAQDRLKRWGQYMIYIRQIEKIKDAIRVIAESEEAS